MEHSGAQPARLLPAVAPRPLLRAVAFAVSSVAFALVAHSTTSHTLPSAWLIGSSVVAVAVTATPMAALEQRFAALVTALVATQLILHAVFVLQATGRTTATAAGWLCCGSELPRQAGTTAVAALTRAHGVSAFDAHRFDRAALVQLAVHVLAALVIASALRLRERAVWRLARQAAARAGTALGQLLAALIAVFASTPPVAAGPLSRRAQPQRSGPSPRRAISLDARAPRRGPPHPPAAGLALRLA